mmetsp:Transcript_3481/g.8953  ORF Transcript_3481/g.8953 Transcript_3481/m.8953 type:complete len:215 (+) Transcript_3481:79-723(+)
MANEIVALEGAEESAVRQAQAYRVGVGTQTLELPLMQIAPNVAICLLMTTDEDIAVMKRAATELAQQLPAVDAVASAATLGIQVGLEVAAAMGLRRQYVLHKTDKKHLSDALVEPLESITTAGSQALRLDKRWLPHLRGKRVAFVDDVISSGGSASAAVRLLRAAGADVVAVAAILVEGDKWRPALHDVPVVSYLAKIPVFTRPGPGDPWTPDA